MTAGATPEAPDPGGSAGASEATDAATLAIDVRRGNPTDDELAAAVAVLSEAYAQESADAIADDDRRDVWALAGRGLRDPLRRELGWRGFRG